MRRALGVLVALATVLGGPVACGDDDDPPAQPPDTAPPQPPPVPDVPAAGEPGTGTLVFGLEEVALDVAGCELEPREASGGVVVLIGARATGRLSDGTPVVVDISRFQSEAEATTFTDTVEITDLERTTGIRAQRIEVNGVIADERDPEARSPLIVLDGDTLSAAGVFGPTGTEPGNPDEIGGAVTFACPTA